MESKGIIIDAYVHGRASGAPGPGGVGYVIVERKKRTYSAISKVPNHGYRWTTERRMQLLAVQGGLSTAEACLQRRIQDAPGEMQGATIIVHCDAPVADALNGRGITGTETDIWDKIRSCEAYVKEKGITVRYVKNDTSRNERWVSVAREACTASLNYGVKETDLVFEKTSPMPGNLHTLQYKEEDDLADYADKEMGEDLRKGHISPETAALVRTLVEKDFYIPRNYRRVAICFGDRYFRSFLNRVLEGKDPYAAFMETDRQYSVDLKKRKQGTKTYQIAVTLPLTLWVETEADSDEAAINQARDIALATPLSEWGDDMSTAQYDIVND